MGANYYPRLAGYPEYAATQVAAIGRQLDGQNRNAKAIFDGAVAQWLSEAGGAQDRGAPIPPKPVAPALAMLETYETAAGVWQWQTDGPPVGVCPDLPPSHMAVNTGIAEVRSVDPVAVLTQMMGQALGDLQRIKQALAALAAKVG